MSIQEHRHHHPDTDLKYTNRYQLVTTSAVKNSQGSTIGSVGVLISKSLKELAFYWENIWPHNCHRVTLKSVIVCYYPTKTYNDKLADDFYSGLKGVMESVPSHNLLVIAGDFNAQTGRDDALFTYNKETNWNELKLIDFAHKF